MNSAATRHNQGPKSTPIYVDGTLLSIGMTGVVTAWDARTGRQLWQKPGIAAGAAVHHPRVLADRRRQQRDLPRRRPRQGRADRVRHRDRQPASGAGPATARATARRSSPPSAARGRSSRSRRRRSSASTSRPARCSGSGRSRAGRPPTRTRRSLYGQTIIVSGNGGPTVAFTAAKNGATVDDHQRLGERRHPAPPDQPGARRRHAVRHDQPQRRTVFRRRRQDRQDAVDLARTSGRQRRDRASRRLPPQPRRRRRTGGA